MSIQEIVTVVSLLVAGVAWLIRLESKIQQNQSKNEIKIEIQEKDLRRVEGELKELIKSSIRSDEKMADALTKLSISMERTMERMEHLNARLADLQLKQENHNR